MVWKVFYFRNNYIHIYSPIKHTQKKKGQVTGSWKPAGRRNNIYRYTIYTFILINNNKLFINFIGLNLCLCHSVMSSLI